MELQPPEGVAGGSPWGPGREARRLLGVVVPRPYLAAVPAPVCYVGGGDGSAPRCCPQAAARQLRLAPQPGAAGGGAGHLWREGSPGIFCVSPALHPSPPCPVHLAGKLCRAVPVAHPWAKASEFGLAGAVCRVSLCGRGEVPSSPPQPWLDVLAPLSKS